MEGGRGLRRERSYVKVDTTQATLQQRQQQQQGVRRERSFVKVSSTQGAASHTHRRRSMMPATRTKPTMELYRPPTKDIQEKSPRMKLNAEAQEFQPFPHSKSSSNLASGFASTNGSKSNGVPGKGGIQHSKSSGNILCQARQGDKSKVHFHPETKDSFKSHVSLRLSDGEDRSAPGGLQRSLSLGAAEMKASTWELQSLGSFSPEIQNLLQQASEDPNQLSGRSIILLVRHIFTRLVETSRHSETVAKFCISVIEKEATETFLESLLNTCREWFQERDRLLRSSSSQGSIVPAANPRWIAFITFLNEMYCQLKRRQNQLMRQSLANGSSPGLMLLNLLSECCLISMTSPSVNSLAETECLFFVLTSVGRDLEQELGLQMKKLLNCLRDTFLDTKLAPSIRKTLLQLIELQAARWQLPATTVMYYYPSSGRV